MKKKRIVFYTDCPFVGGSEKTILNIINFKKIYENFDIILIYRYSKRYKSELIKLNLNVKISQIKLINFDNLVINLNYSKKLDILKRIGILFISFITLSKIINFFLLYLKIYRLRPDIIHINNGGFPGADSCNLMTIVSGIFSIKTIYTMNNIPIFKKYNLFNKLYIFFIQRNVDTITCGSKFVAAKIKKRFKNKGSNITNCIKFQNYSDPNLAKINQYIENPKYKVFVTAGILTKRKGLIELLDVLAMIKKNGVDNFYLFIFGEGELYREIQDFVLKTELQKNVFLMGYSKNLNNEIDRSDFFILNSKFNEDMPYVLIEALSLNKIILANNLSGII